MKTIYIAVLLLCAALGQAYGKTITMKTAVTSCVATNLTATEYTDCYAQLNFETAANANSTYLFDASLTYFGNGQVIGQSSVGTYEEFISPDDQSCSELCFKYTSDTFANLVSFNFINLYTGCWYCSAGSFSTNGTIRNYFSSDTAIDMYSVWSLEAPAPVPLAPSFILLASAILSVVSLGCRGKRGLA
jgi:hypothetical protein